MAVRILVPDFPVSAVDDEFAMLVAGDLAAGVDRFALSRMGGSDPAVALPSDRPSAVVRYNMLISLAHFSCSLFRLIDMRISHIFNHWLINSD
jgi:hypothetical protein